MKSNKGRANNQQPEQKINALQNALKNNQTEQVPDNIMELSPDQRVNQIVALAAALPQYQTTLFKCIVGEIPHIIMSAGLQDCPGNVLSLASAFPDHQDTLFNNVFEFIKPHINDLIDVAGVTMRDIEVFTRAFPQYRHHVFNMIQHRIEEAVMNRQPNVRHIEIARSFRAFPNRNHELFEIIRPLLNHIIMDPHPVTRADLIKRLAVAMPNRNQDLFNIVRPLLEDIITDINPNVRAESIADITEAFPNYRLEIFETIRPFIADLIMDIHPFPIEQANITASLAKAFPDQCEALFEHARQAIVNILLNSQPDIYSLDRNLNTLISAFPDQQGVLACIITDYYFDQIIMAQPESRRDQYLQVLSKAFDQFSDVFQLPLNEIQNYFTNNSENEVNKNVSTLFHIREQNPLNISLSYALIQRIALLTADPRCYDKPRQDRLYRGTHRLFCSLVDQRADTSRETKTSTPHHGIQ